MTDNKNIDTEPRSAVIDLLAEAYQDREKAKAKTPTRSKKLTADVLKKFRDMVMLHPEYPIIPTLTPGTGSPEDSFGILEIKECYFTRIIRAKDKIIIHIPFVLEHVRSVVKDIAPSIPEDAPAQEVIDAYNNLPWEDGIVVELGPVTAL